MARSVPIPPAPDVLFWLSLTALRGGTRRVLRRLLERYPRPRTIFERSRQELAAWCSAEVAAQIERGPDLETARSELGRLQALGARLLTPDGPEFPATLATIPDPPVLLFACGKLPRAPALAIVGARKATRRGRLFARTLAAAAVRAGIPVISGLAYGIDAAGHEGALEGAAHGSAHPGLAVWGSGFAQPAPLGNAVLARRLLGAGGAWLSEYPPGQPALPHQFPERNRLISGLSRAVLVVEADLASGSLWTARHALDQGREVLSVPGPIDVAVCRGSNALLRDGAAPVLEPADVLLAFGRSLPSPSRQPQPEGTAGRLWAALEAGPAELDALAARLELDAPSLNRALVALELDGRVVRIGSRIART